MVSVLLKRSALLCLVSSLTACATQNQSRMVHAASAPLHDLNLIQLETPDVLIEALKEPYALPADLSCTSLIALVQKFDSALGPDLDVPASESDPGLLERGVSETQNAAVGALRRTTESLVPFRSWIRKLTGAEAYAKKRAAAIAAGTVRRAFIKGLGIAWQCSWWPPSLTAKNQPFQE